MNLNPRRETITVQDEFLLNTQGLMFKVGGVTLKGSAFAGGNGVVKGGTAIMKEAATGLFIPYADNAGAFPAGAEVYLLAQDVNIKNSANMPAGALIKAYVKTSKLTGVTTAFKTATADRIIYG